MADRIGDASNAHRPAPLAVGGACHNVTMAEPAGRRVWRTRWWVRLLAVAVPVAASPFLFYPPWSPNTEWRDSGMPADEWFWSVVIFACLALMAWAAFRARVELSAGRVQVVNPFRSTEFPASTVVDVRPGALGVEFLLSSGQVVSAFAVQCTAVHVGPEPRWVGVARAVTGRTAAEARRPPLPP
jgi:hypothetical protein